MRNAKFTLLRCGLTLALAALLGVAWRHFDAFETLVQHLPQHIRVAGIGPVYARYQPIDVAEQRQHIVRAVVAMLSGLTVCWLAFRIRSLPRLIALVSAVLSVASINCSVAAIRGGWDALDRPFARTQLEYLGDVPKVGDAPVAFAREYPTRSRELSLHAATHPPGGVLVLWAGSKLFGDSPTAASSLAIALSSLAIVPAWWLAQLVGGRALARRVVPICAAAPALVLFGATSMDGVFTTAMLFALATGVWAVRRASTWSSLWRAPIAGACLWIAAFLTFTAALVPAVLMLATLVSRPRLTRYAALVLTGVSFITIQGVIQLITGYDFIATAQAAMRKDEWAMSTTGYRTQEEWLALSVNNLAAFAFAGTGLALFGAAAAGIPFAALRWRSYASRFALAVWAVLLAAAFSTLFTLETERVWMSLVPLFAIAAATFVRDRVSLVLLIVLLAVQTILTEINCYTYW